MAVNSCRNRVIKCLTRCCSGRVRGFDLCSAYGGRVRRRHSQAEAEVATTTIDSARHARDEPRTADLHRGLTLKARQLLTPRSRHTQLNATELQSARRSCRVHKQFRWIQQQQQQLLLLLLLLQHNNPFNGPLSRTTQVSRYQKGIHLFTPCRCGYYTSLTDLLRFLDGP